MGHKQYTTESTLKLGNSFMESRIFLTGAELDLYSLLASRPLSIDEILSETKTDRRGMTILLDALCALGLLVKDNNRYQTEESITPILTANSPDSILPIALHICTLWKTWSKLTDAVLGKDRGQLEKQGALADGHIQAFIGAMHMVALRNAPEAVNAVSPGVARRLIDVGGGSGSYTLAFLNAVPDMKATLFDLPEVIEMARARLEEAGMIERVTLKAGNFYIDELPA